jgi:hypothetical protein
LLLFLLQLDPLVVDDTASLYLLNSDLILNCRVQLFERLLFFNHAFVEARERLLVVELSAFLLALDSGVGHLLVLVVSQLHLASFLRKMHVAARVLHRYLSVNSLCLFNLLLRKVADVIRGVV